MPQDPLSLAIIGGVFVLFANVVGQSIATFFGTRAAAHLSAEAARDVAGINAAAQTRLEEQRELRQWKRDRVAPVLVGMGRRFQLEVDLVNAAGQEDWEQVDAILETLGAREAIPEFFVLNAMGSEHLSLHLSVLQSVETKWLDSMRLMLPRWRDGITVADDENVVSISALHGARMHAFQAIQAYIYGGEPEHPVWPEAQAAED